jgi:Spy/CpxP family protein refolding chaperone
MRQGPMRFDRLLENPEIAKKIGLTDEQIETLKEEQYKLQTQKIDLRAKMEKAALEQARLLTKEDSSDEEILEAVEETGKIRTELAVVGMQQLLVIRRVLTKEQREKIQKMMRRHSHGRFRDFGRPHGGAQGGRKCPGGGPEGRSFGGRASRCGGACPKGEACECPRRRPAPPAKPKSSKQMDDDLAG